MKYTTCTCGRLSNRDAVIIVTAALPVVITTTDGDLIGPDGTVYSGIPQTMVGLHPKIVQREKDCALRVATAWEPDGEITEYVELGIRDF